MDFEKIITAAPVNAQSARQMGRGVEWMPRVKLDDWYPEKPETKPVTPAMRRRDDFVDFTGSDFGRLRVVGLAVQAGGAKASWVCRCKCGDYCKRRTKSLKRALQSSERFVDRCGRCVYVNSLRNGWLPAGDKNKDGSSRAASDVAQGGSE